MKHVGLCTQDGPEEKTGEMRFQIRAEGIDVPVRVGIPGPADVGKLLRCARQFVVVTSAGIARRYGLSLTNLLQHVGPERFFERLASELTSAPSSTISTRSAASPTASVG
jgi:hypothetical protein